MDCMETGLCNTCECSRKKKSHLLFVILRAGRFQIQAKENKSLKLSITEFEDRL